MSKNVVTAGGGNSTGNGIIPSGWFSASYIDTTGFNKMEPLAMVDFWYIKDVQQITLGPGTYRMECWGAAGTKSGGGNDTYHTGGYASGVMTIPQGKTYTFYVYVGGKPVAGIVEGGWNGGGCSNGGSSDDDGMGGGATDICLVPSAMTIDTYRTIRTQESYLSRVIVAGGSGSSRGGTPYTEVYGGSYNRYGTGTYCGKYTSAGQIDADTTRVPYPGGFGYGTSTVRSGSTDSSGGSGAGWYGGGIKSDNGGGGGSSFVWSTQMASYVPSGYSVPNELKMTNVQFACGDEVAHNYNYQFGYPRTRMDALNLDGHARITRIK